MQRPRTTLQLSKMSVRAAAIFGLSLIAAVVVAQHWFGILAAGSVFAGLVFALAAGWLLIRTTREPIVNVERAIREGQRTDDIAPLIEALDVPAILLDQSEIVLGNNATANELFPLIRTGQPLSAICRNPELQTAVMEARSLRSRRTCEIVDRLPYLRRLFVSVSPVGQPDAAAGIAGPDLSDLLLVQFRDLTEQDRLAQLRSDFIANASHEIRTPLSILKGFIETLRGAARHDPASQDKFLAIMDDQARRMTRIVNDLLSLSRIEMRAHILPEGTVDIEPLVKSVVQSVGKLAEDAKIKLSVSGPARPGLVRGDRDELEQVFQNLIENAIKYGRPGGRVEISISRLPAPTPLPDRIAVAVQDDGPGIDEVHIPRLTERFYRADKTASRERGGTGLGLAIVKHILNRHRGELQIQSRLGVGSTFTVIFDGAATPAA